MVPMAKATGAGQWEVGTGPQQPLPHLLCTRGVGESGTGAGGPTIPELLIRYCIQTQPHPFILPLHQGQAYSLRKPSGFDFGMC